MSIIVYFLKVSVSLMLFWLMYRLVFKKLTFFAFNRFFLLGSVLLSFTIPLIKFNNSPLNMSIADYTLGIDWEQFVFAPNVMESTALNSSSGITLSTHEIFATISALWS